MGDALLARSSALTTINDEYVRFNGEVAPPAREREVGDEGGEPPPPREREGDLYNGGEEAPPAREQEVGDEGGEPPPPREREGDLYDGGEEAPPTRERELGDTSGEVAPPLRDRELGDTGVGVPPPRRKTDGDADGEVPRLASTSRPHVSRRERGGDEGGTVSTWIEESFPPPRDVRRRDDGDAPAGGFGHVRPLGADARAEAPPLATLSLPFCSCGGVGVPNCRPGETPSEGGVSMMRT